MEIWSILSGAVVMLFMQVLKNNTWPDAAKVILAVVLCVLLGTIQWALQYTFKTLTWEILVTNAGAIFAIAVGMYKLYFQNVGWMKSLGEIKVL